MCSIVKWGRLICFYITSIVNLGDIQCSEVRSIVNPVHLFCSECIVIVMKVRKIRTIRKNRACRRLSTDWLVIKNWRKVIKVPLYVLIYSVRWLGLSFVLYIYFLMQLCLTWFYFNLRMIHTSANVVMADCCICWCLIQFLKYLLPFFVSETFE